MIELNDVSNIDIWKALILLTVLTILDYQTTLLVISIHGYQAELNPLLYYLMVQTDSVKVVLYAKVILLAITWATVAKEINHIQNKRLIITIIYVVSLFHGYVIGKAVYIYTIS